ncbi:MAG: hypothetical protein NC250_03200, partial [Alistipes senegalensis]|nr:hypothetical protein [Bacteroides cellulosilyticus]MCM1351724.1 hypothetical protein [Alistipes senegalensis]
NTYSGAYTVMPMALGATKVVVFNDSDAEKAKGLGLWYQWGRKDPLGRPSAIASSTSSDVYVAALTKNSNTFFTNRDDGINNCISQMTEMYNAGYIDSETSTALNVSEVEMEINGQQVPVSASRYMIDKTVANPTQFVCCGELGTNWTVMLNHYLWGNPDGYNYPRQSQTYKSVFDPCPNGYRTAPKDLWINFLTDLTKTTTKLFYNINNSNYSRGYDFYYKGMGTTELDETETAVEYKKPEGSEGVDWATDFYVIGGMRSLTTGAFLYVTSAGCYWSGSPSAISASTFARLDFNPGLLSPLASAQMGYALSLRCVKEN